MRFHFENFRVKEKKFSICDESSEKTKIFSIDAKWNLMRFSQIHNATTSLTFYFTVILHDNGILMTFNYRCFPVRSIWLVMRGKNYFFFLFPQIIAMFFFGVDDGEVWIEEFSQRNLFFTICHSPKKYFRL